MNILKLSRITSEWSSKVGKHIKDCPPNMKVVTGDYNTDRQLHYFEQESGIALQISTETGPSVIKSYDIVDEQKYICFLLRWA